MAFDLGAMLRDVSELDTSREQIEYIPLDLIDSDPNNFYRLTDIEDLADNISLCGLQQPIRVRQQEGGRYMIVSGHRRRAALDILVANGYERFREAPCIVERDEVSPALQQLRLIFANSNTRKMSDAEISEQSAQIEKLLYQLKEEEGYEFPGRMRDHVSEIVGISKSKLARLKVIREKLSHVWSASWKKGKLNESVAYELSKLPDKWQQVIYRARGENGYLDAKYIKEFGERFRKIAELKCKKNPANVLCNNAELKQTRVASGSPFSVFYCDKCCARCPELSSCKYVCPVHASKAQELRADKRAARKLEIAAEREADRPKVEKVEAIWNRFGTERVSAGCSVKDIKEAMGLHYWNDEQTKYEKLESGTAKISSGTKLPFGIYLSDISNLIALAELFGCSVDYLLCRTDIKEMAQQGGAVSEPGTMWHPITEEPPIGVDLVWLDAQGYSDTAEYLGSERIESASTISWPEARYWAYMPEEE